MSAIHTAVRRWALWLGLGLAAALPAQAAVYTGIWDPAYGAPFTNLGWRGDSTYFVPDGCELAGTGLVDNAAACDGQAIVTQARVEFYDINDSQTSTLATLIFDPQSMVIGQLSYIGGVLSALETSSSAFTTPVGSLLDFGVEPGTMFSLRFTLADGPRLDWLSCPDNQDCSRGTNDATNFPARFTIQQVPEPGSLALAALALGVAGLARRRA